MMIISLALGIALLVVGRKLFWICVGGIGFMAGMAIGSFYLHGQSEPLRVVLSLGIGLVGAILAFFLQRLAVGLAGFVAGAYLAYAALERFAPASGGIWWLPVLLGGILGTIVLLMAFEWTLIVLSSLTGAAFILQSFHPQETAVIPMFIVLTVCGIVIQSGMLRKKHSHAGSAATSKG